MLECQVHKDEKYIEIIVDGEVSKEEYEHMVMVFEERSNQWGNVNMLLVVKKIGYVEPSVFWEDLKFAYNHIKEIGHIGVVTEKTWMEPLGKVFEPFVNFEMKFFEPEESEKAIAWMKALS